MREIHHHVDSEEAERYLMGNTPDEETAELAEHLLACEYCRMNISNVELYLDAMSKAAGELRRRAAASRQFQAVN